MNIVTRTLLGLAMALVAASQVHASVIIEGTRVVFPGDQREVSVRMTNEYAYPVLVEAWLEADDKKALPAGSAMPFVVTPPLFRMEPSKGQSLRIFRAPAALPTDRESLFWLNVKDLPPEVKDGSNKLKIAFRSRLKMFYRPAGLAGDAHAAPQQLQWRVAGAAMVVKNPTPYYVTLLGVKHISHGAVQQRYEGGMVSPFGELTLPASAAVPPGTEAVAEEHLEGVVDEIRYGFINDQGGLVPLTGHLSP